LGRRGFLGLFLALNALDPDRRLRKNEKEKGACWFVARV
jgi:hypothetical protein